MEMDCNQELNCVIEETTDSLEDLNIQIASSELLIFHVNIRSLNANFEKLELFLDRLQHKPLLAI